MRPLLVAVMLFALSANAARAVTAANADPPAGILVTQMSLSKILALHKIAVGQAPSSACATTITWFFSMGDLQGKKIIVSSGDDYREDTSLGPFHSARGSYRGQEWDQNANGLTVLGSGIHRRDEINKEALRHALVSGSGVTLLGQVLVPRAAYVVRVAPPNGRVEYVYYDKDSYLIVRTERAVEDQRVVTTYEDFHTTNGARWAWHVHETDGRPYNDNDWALESFNDKTPVDPAIFQPPPSDASHFTLAAPKVVLPGKILADRIILTAQMGGHKVDFQLDSGASQILLDKSVADALHFPAYGAQTETTAGTYTITRSLVPRIDFGGAALENVAVYTAPFHQWADESTPVAGLLGYDFIANCVLHVDYLHGEADVLSPSSFQPPANAFAVPIRLEDRVPAIDVKISATTSDRFILDTGADRSALFSAFVTAHPNAAADQGLGEQFIEAYPFLSGVSGVGGEISVTHTQVPSLSIGPVTFPRWLFSVVHDAPAFEGEDYDGLIGQDVLRNFDIYLDYQRSKIYFVPNDRYRERWGT